MTQPADPSQDVSAFVERVALRLAASGARAQLVQLVERWVQVGAPPRMVLLAEVRALLGLCLMDRAWVRLRELTDHDPDDVEALSLTGEMFLQRGWPQRARKPLSHAIELSPARDDLRAMLRRAHAEPVGPPANARELERTAPPAQLLELAEAFMRAGSHLRAKGLLERVRRVEGPWQARADELLWGLRGDLAGDEALVTLARRFAPELEEETNDPVSFTDSLTGEVTAISQFDGPEEGPGFPSLFRGGGFQEVGFDDDGDVTAVSRMESLPPPDPDATEADDAVDEADDTQIMLVIKQDEPPPPPPPSTRNLADLAPEELGRIELEESELEPDVGGLHLSDMVADDEDFLEDEDEDVIIMTRKEEEPAPERILHEGPVEVVESEPASQAPAPAAPAPDTPEPAPASSSAGGWLAWAAVGLGLLAALGWGGKQLYVHLSASAIVDDAVATVASRDYPSLRTAEAQLSAEVAAGTEPLGPRLAALSLVQMVHWADYSGDVSRLKSAQDLLAEAAVASGPKAGLGLVSAWLSFYQGDLGAAEGAADALGDDHPEVLLLRSAIGLTQGEPAVARLWAQRAVAASAEPRYLAALVRACLAAEDEACARDAVGRVREAGLLGLEVEATYGTPDATLARLEDEVRRSDLPTRVRGQAHYLRGVVLDRLGRHEEAEQAVEFALNDDPENGVYLHRLAGSYVRTGRILRALSAVDRCVELHPLDRDYQEAAFQLRLDQDQIERAGRQLDALPSSMAEAPWVALLRAQLALHDDQGPEKALELAAASGVPENDPRRLYVEGLANGMLGQPALSGVQLSGAAEAFEQGADPVLQALAPRALASAARYGRGDDRAAWAEAAGTAAPDDPWVLLELARYERDLGNEIEAANLYDQAARSAPDAALAHYERAQYYMDLGDNLATSTAAWREYLDLSPSGPRADRVRRILGR